MNGHITYLHLTHVHLHTIHVHVHTIHVHLHTIHVHVCNTNTDCSPGTLPLSLN